MKLRMATILVSAALAGAGLITAGSAAALAPSATPAHQQAPEGCQPPPLGPDGKPLPPPLGPDGRPLPPPNGADGKPCPPPLGPDGKPLPPPPGAPLPPPPGA
ncbi:hypothetical protein BJY24_007453 [Nocardia transvalensis]|uniref:Uncharacterized protein n=1 Tax=Nocardia transvalensis TaxID=37333 RepID=A0A7W9UME6_9NOCA|nr:hypothetical protein [Nocardia transvalensis]MBB5918541.1 hypothetical protein [Nocardia transvalensis]